MELRKLDNILPNKKNEFRYLVDVTLITLRDKIVKENSEFTKINEYFDKHTTKVNYKIGHLVLFKLQQGLSAEKLATRWDGSYRTVATEGHNFKLRRIAFLTENYCHYAYILTG